VDAVHPFTSIRAINRPFADQRGNSLLRSVDEVLRAVALLEERGVSSVSMNSCASITLGKSLSEERDRFVQIAVIVVGCLRALGRT
jgi:hypothetical protein